MTFEEVDSRKQVRAGESDKKTGKKILAFFDVVCPFLACNSPRLTKYNLSSSILSYPIAVGRERRMNERTSLIETKFINFARIAGLDKQLGFGLTKLYENQVNEVKMLCMQSDPWKNKNNLETSDYADKYVSIGFIFSYFQSRRKTRLFTLE